MFAVVRYLAKNWLVNLNFYLYKELWMNADGVNWKDCLRQYFIHSVKAASSSKNA